MLNSVNIIGYVSQEIDLKEGSQPSPQQSTYAQRQTQEIIQIDIDDE